MKLVDLHVHSTASDGSLTPEQIVKKAKELDLAAIALTDHDTIAGLAEFMQAGEKYGVETIRGMETSVNVDGCDVHLVCLFFDPTYPKLVEELKKMAQSRQDRNVAIIEKLEKEGFNISMDDFKKYGDRAIARGHIAQVLIDNQFPNAVPKAIIREYLSKGKVGYVQRKTPPPNEFIKIIHEAGGLVFVAHLHQIDKDDSEHCIKVFEMLVKMGVDGLETRYCEYNDFWKKLTKRLARKYHMLESGGSDFHGAIKPKLEIKTGYGDLEVPCKFLERMKRKLKKNRKDNVCVDTHFITIKRGGIL